MMWSNVCANFDGETTLFGQRNEEKAGSQLYEVTGGNKGIGFSIVKFLCQRFDGDVFLTARDETRGKAAVAELNKQLLHPKFHQLDIDDLDSIKRLRDFLKRTYGGLDVLVNNAGIAFKVSSTAPFAEQAEVTVKTNFFGTLNVCKELFPLLRPHARVVNLSSVCGMLKRIPGDEVKRRLKNPDITLEELCGLMKEFVQAAKEGKNDEKGWGHSAYNASKVGITVLSFIQQREFNADPREDLVVNAVHPGYVDTDMTSHKGPLTPDQGADAPTYLALLPPNIKSPKGEFVWNDRTVTPWDK
ncbi:carbonyl reductase [NADPH] 1-like isoform X2 [Dermacentor variabilis]|uniref:carbonyl reductase [NADPH] 1-like isoform X2 n=1 Tax=Dermacentor variabilis TaxID=34621 RepID=UPI003F5B7F83